jgi:hypothetical protein
VAFFKKKNSSLSTTGISIYLMGNCFNLGALSETFYLKTAKLD